MHDSIFSKTFLNSEQKIIPYDGSPLSWRVSVYALVRKGNEVLIIKGKQEKMYDITGGGVNLGEDLEQALSRECMEEAGATIKIGHLLSTEFEWFYHKSGKYYQTVELFYEGKLVGELQDPTDENIEWRGFVPISDIGTKYIVRPIVAALILKNQDSKQQLQ